MGALGEVGSSVSRALSDLGHEVLPVSSRAGSSDVDAHSLEDAADLVASGNIDLVVNAAGRGDKRMVSREPALVSGAIGEACERAGVRGVLISTVRVLEDASEAVPGAAPAQCHSDYACANADNEEKWLAAAPEFGHVLRLANYFCAPMGVDSPQTQLLPWSLVSEALTGGRITVRSTSTVAREFVSARDVAQALVAIVQAESPARVCSTVPGLRLTLEQLTTCVSEAFVTHGLPRPEVSFGSDTASGPTLLGDWLAETGWTSTLTVGDVVDAVGGWLSEHSSLLR